MSDCPGPEEMSAYAEGRLGDPAALEGHLVSCPSCRRSAIALSRIQPSRAARPWWPTAAAALLLMTLSLIWVRRERTPALPSPSAPFASGDSTFLLGHATSVTLRAGSRWDPLLGLLEGAAFVEDPGEPCRIRVPGGVVVTSKGSFLIEILPAKAVFWMKDACAAEASPVRIWVRDGSAELRLDSGETTHLLPSPAPPGWKGEAGWRKEAPASEPYVWETLLGRRDPTASVSVRFPAAGKLWEMPLGAPLLEAKDLLRVRVEVLDGWVRIRAGSYDVLEARVEGLPERMRPVEGKPGLRVWGGKAEVLETRCR